MYVDGRLRATMFDELDGIVATRIAPRVEALRAAQDPTTGALTDHAIATAHLGALVRAVQDAHELLGTPAAGQAFCDDAKRWRFDGFGAPRFDRTIAALRAPVNLEPFLFVGPVRDVVGTPRLEYGLGVRHEPTELRDVVLRVPVPVVERAEIRMVDASAGLGRDELCVRDDLVFGFPQAAARVLANHVVPAAVEASGRDDWACARLAPGVLYRMVCVRAYVDDVHTGERWYPDDDHWDVDPAGSVLDALRVDAATAVLAIERDLPFADAILEVTCFARLFPRVPDDRAMQIRRFLFAWLARHGEGALRFHSGYLDFDRSATRVALVELLGTIRSLDGLDVHDRRIESRLLVAKYSRSGSVVQSA